MAGTYFEKTLNTKQTFNNYSNYPFMELMYLVLIYGSIILKIKGVLPNDFSS